MKNTRKYIVQVSENGFIIMHTVFQHIVAQLSVKHGRILFECLHLGIKIGVCNIL